MKVKILAAVVVISMSTLSGCASYRVSSNVDAAQPVSAGARENVIITEKTLPLGTYQSLGAVEVSIKKLTAFHKDPTKAQADAALREKAVILGADAVMDVRYSSGVGMTTWGYMDAKGKAVKLHE